MEALNLYLRQGGMFHPHIPPSHGKKGVVRMRLTFHIGKYTVTIIVRKTAAKARTQHDKKTAATPRK